ncbi:fimbrial protein [Escherichia coli]|uniref:fimbrial protein n=1 Tax=Escherichia coli TaxID=562 RepID=UPI00200B9A72|nr:fimbrial protein [Escherichia coli]
MHNKIFLLLLTVFCSPMSLAEEVSASVDLKMNVNIIKPVCRLTSKEAQIDFGEFDVSALKDNHPTGSAIYKFTECDNVNQLRLSFTGEHIDISKNIIKNKTNEDAASGIAVKLYDNQMKELILDKDWIIEKDIKKNNYDLTINAKIVPSENGGTASIRPGKIDTAVNFEITYE